MSDPIDGTEGWLVDASVALKWFLPAEREPDADLARAALGRLTMRTTDLAVYEVAHVLTTHSGWDAARIEEALTLLTEICGTPVELLAPDRRLAAELALAHGLTFYDASYAAIASRLGRRVLSADSDLLKPGLAVGLNVALS